MANKYLETDLLDRAIIFAVKAHHNTERRGKGFPYIVHPMEAVEIVASITPDQELLAAAALHDTIEDTDVTVEELQAEASKYESRTEFQDKGTKYYNYALRHHIIDEVCSMLPKRKKIKSKYTIEILDDIVAGCVNLAELRKKHSGAAKAIYREHLEKRYFIKVGKLTHLKRPPYQ